MNELNHESIDYHWMKEWLNNLNNLKYKSIITASKKTDNQIKWNQIILRITYPGNQPNQTKQTNSTQPNQTF